MSLFLTSNFSTRTTMKRPSNLIFLFVGAIVAVFLAYALGRIVLRVVAPPEIEIEQYYESQL